MRAVFSDNTRKAVLPNSRIARIRPAILTRGFWASSSCDDLVPYFETTSGMLWSTSALVGKGSKPSSTIRASFSRRTRINSDSGTSSSCKAREFYRAPHPALRATFSPLRGRGCRGAAGEGYTGGFGGGVCCAGLVIGCAGGTIALAGAWGDGAGSAFCCTYPDGVG